MFKGRGNWGTLRIPREDWGTLGNIREYQGTPSPWDPPLNNPIKTQKKRDELSPSCLEILESVAYTHNAFEKLGNP